MVTSRFHDFETFSCSDFDRRSEGDEADDQNLSKSTENKRAKERERRRHISVSIDDLRRVIPLRFQKERLNQVATMAMAVDYIRYLQQHIVELEAALAQRRGYEGIFFLMFLLF